MRADLITWAERVAEAIGTPFFAYDRSAAPKVIAAIERGLQAWGPGQVAYSLKTNPLSALLHDVRAAGAWAEVVSNHEYWHARSAGFEPGEIVFNGPLKAAGITDEALGCALLNADSLEELDVIEHAACRLGCRARVGLRVSPPRTGPSWSRFGLSVETGEFDQGIARVRASQWMALAGLHAHLGTQVQNRRTYQSSIRVLRELWQDYHLSEDLWLDIGGGYPFVHDATGEYDDWLSFFADLASEWSSRRPFLIVEPGRVVAGPTMTLVCRILAHKRRPREPIIVVTDGGTNHNVMGAFFEHAWEFSVVEGPADVSFRLCGPLCMEDDVMSGERRGSLPKPGTIAAMRNVGAYSLSLARSFIQPVPPVVDLCDDTANVLLPRADYSRAFGSAHPASTPYL
jgi:diaminopimelate decarboxylase